MMTTVNGFTLLPHNGWATGSPVKCSRKWQTGVGNGVLGNEARAALRQLPLHKLSCTFLAATLPERARMEARIDQATESGLAALPFLGRVMWLAANAAAGGDTLTLLDATIWNWQAGDWVFLFADDATFDAVQVQSVAGLTLTLMANLANTWPAQANVWPLLFGKFSSQKQTAMNAAIALWAITVEEMVNARSAQLGAVVPPTGTGIGVDQVGISNPIT